jgi:pyridoxal phosphate enzyme (YggS family)
MSEALLTAWRECRDAVERAAAGRSVTLVAVSKTRPALQVRALAAAGQRHFGENYLGEALAKMEACTDLDLCWHFIGPLQSNKAAQVATRFDWLHSVDRPRLVAALAGRRPPDRPPLNVLVQVNIDAEASKSGCTPAQVPALAAAVAAVEGLRLRGLMTIPDPALDPARAGGAFERMQALFAALQYSMPGIDTLSMGMSEDFPAAIAHGATMVRVGSAVFGPRPARAGPGPADA